jgi:anti-anti-sigma factor
VDAFRLDLGAEGTSVIITVSGELDIGTADKLTDLAKSSLLHPNTRKLVLDLHQVTFLDSSGLAALVALRQCAETEGKLFGLRATSPHVFRLLELSGMAKYFAAERYTQ